MFVQTIIAAALLTGLTCPDGSPPPDGSPCIAPPVVSVDNKNIADNRNIRDWDDDRDDDDYYEYYYGDRRDDYYEYYRGRRGVDWDDDDYYEYYYGDRRDDDDYYEYYYGDRRDDYYEYYRGRRGVDWDDDDYYEYYYGDRRDDDDYYEYYYGDRRDDYYEYYRGRRGVDWDDDDYYEYYYGDRRDDDAAIARAADARPRPGSVTQSSNVRHGITVDRVRVTAERQYAYDMESLAFSLQNGSSWSLSPERNAVATPVYYFPRLSAIKIQELNNVFIPFRPSSDRSPSIGTSTVIAASIYSDAEAATAITGPDTDYLAFGFWLVAPPGTWLEDVQVGVFADGNDPFRQSHLSTLQGTASYTGNMVAIFPSVDGPELLARHRNRLYGDVALTVDFGDGSGLGTIGGAIDNMKIRYTPAELVSGETGPEFVPYPGRLNLGEADIGSSHSGFFEGRVTGSAGGRSYSGNWGGQFYGNREADGKPGSVAGTFGAKSNDEKMNLLGAFAAHKQ